MGIASQIRTARLCAVYERLPVTVAITVVGGAAAAAMLAAGGASSAVWAWLGVVVALAAARMIGWAAFRCDPMRVSGGWWMALAVGGALASGLLWGMGSALLPVGHPAAGGVIGQVVLVLLLGAMSAGAATVHAVHVPTALAFIVPAGLPLAVHLALLGDRRHTIMAAMVLLITAVLSMVARRSGRAFGETVGLQIALAERGTVLDETNLRLRAEIDDHRATGEILRQAQRMEAIGQLTGGVAHDFNNVLAVIGGNLQLIARHGAGNADITRLVEAAEAAASRGARLTASLLSFAREQALRPEVVDLNMLVGEVAPLLRRTLGERTELALDLAPEPLMVRVDAAQLQAALLHLVINARDANPAGRGLTVGTCANIDGACAPGPDGAVHEGHFSCVCVRDTGPGMAPDVAARAFEPFFTTKDVGQGSGLGLSQVFGFARQSGGTARIANLEGGGMSVSILLPAGAQNVAAEPVLSPVIVGRVLLVEDDAGLRDVLRECLSAGGWQVLEVVDGEAGCAVLKGEAPIDIVVSDVMMPGAVNGVALARAAARLRPGLPVLLISGFSAAALRDQGGGEFDLLDKPFTHAELIRRMQLALAAGRAAVPIAAGN